MAANADDWAVVIGIRRYADANANPPWISNLNGPDNDASAVAEWLTHDEGGGLPPDNVDVIRSADFPPGGGVGPQQKAVIDAFKALTKLPATAFDGQHAGRRLYIYVSGHGLAAQRMDAAVITAEATQNDAINVLVTSWLDWLWYAARFKEYVLWVDTCATRTSPPIILTRCKVPPQVRTDAADGRLFQAFAAGYNQTAVENQIKGEWHGVFTYALLQGLSGVAGTPVTTTNLRNYLFNSMKTFMTPAQRESPAVAKEPAFGTTDDLEFASPPQQPTFMVTLRFPPECVAKRATISVDKASPLVADEVLGGTQWQVQLRVGAYVVFVPELNLEQPFQVDGGESNAEITVL